jgi:hypothetical protein
MGASADATDEFARTALMLAVTLKTAPCTLKPET